MNIVDLEKVINNKDYDFLRNNDRLKDNVCYLTFGGSYAYGTNVETSDIDIRGFVLPQHTDLIGFTSFEQFIDNDTDTVLYEFNKFISLLLNCNPNTIEILSPREDIYIGNKTAQELLSIKHAFLSKRVVKSFSGYAHQQLRRLENLLCYDTYKKIDTNVHLCETLKNNLYHLDSRYSFSKYGTISFDVNDTVNCSMHLDNMPIIDIKSMLSEIGEIINTYNVMNHRNRKKDVKHLNKHAMHLIRLYLMALDILEKEEIVTYRKDDIPFLMDVRNGKYLKEDGTYDSAFFDMVNGFKNRLQYAIKNTNLPDKPDTKTIEEFVINVNTEVIMNAKS